MPEILIVGHVSIDRIKNIHGEKIQPGGAALYAAMGARTICRDVGILSAIGDDYKFYDVLSLFSNSIIKRVKGKSTSFSILYDKDWNAIYKEVFIGPGSRITTRDLINALKYNVKALHIAPMNPPKVEKMIKEIKSKYKNIIISLNSSIHYFNKINNRRAILNAANLCDFFILNERELHALTEIEVVSEALKLLKSKVVVLTLGEIGTLIKSENNIEFVPAMAAITKNIVDVTGAGDTWAGSFLASYLKSKSWSKAVSFASVISAIKCTGWNFEKIMNLNFNNIEEIYEFAITLKEKSKQLTLTDIWKNKLPSPI
ncbi:MAG: carbohydrate kinase family protein [Candidatus Methanomethylicaceae archaeon]|nr:carbohydrate kinase family protein [Candidatus Verstraetearchaeota archaeon]